MDLIFICLFARVNNSGQSGFLSLLLKQWDIGMTCKVMENLHNGIVFKNQRKNKRKLNDSWCWNFNFKRVRCWTQSWVLWYSEDMLNWYSGHLELVLVKAIFLEDLLTKFVLVVEILWWSTMELVFWSIIYASLVILKAIWRCDLTKDNKHVGTRNLDNLWCCIWKWNNRIMRAAIVFTFRSFFSGLLSGFLGSL